MSVRVLADRGLRCIEGVMQYSGGIAAEAGHRLVRVRFPSVLPMAAGWRAIAGWLAARHLPRTAFCACELRSPAPFTEDGFRAFNTSYAATLGEWGILAPDGINPVARSNVCPAIDPPAEPGFFAFVACIPGTGGGFVVSGSAETPGAVGNYSDGIIAPGDSSAAGMRAKADWVLGEMERRLSVLGYGWPDVTASQAYAVHEMLGVMQDLVVPRGAARGGLTWHFARPPVVGLEFEMDVRGIAEELVLGA